jgi:hypothetical protein
VNVHERLTQADADRHGFGPADTQAELGGATPNLTQIAAFDVFDHHVRRARLVGGRLEDLSNSWMLKLRLDPGFIQEARLEGAVIGVIGADDLDDQRTLRALDARRGGQVDLAHAPARNAG